MRCTCSMKPSNVRIIKIGKTETGIIDLDRTIIEVYLEGLEDESLIRDELFRRLKEKNYIPEKYADLYAEAFLREYRSFVESREPKKQTKMMGISENTSAPGRKGFGFFHRLFSKK